MGGSRDSLKPQVTFTNALAARGISRAKLLAEEIVQRAFRLTGAVT